MARTMVHNRRLSRWLCAILALALTLSVTGLVFADEPTTPETPQVEAPAPEEPAPESAPEPDEEPPPAQEADGSVEAGPVTIEPVTEEPAASEEPSADEAAGEPTDAGAPTLDEVTAPIATPIPAEQEVGTDQTEPELPTYKVRKFHDWDEDGEKDEQEPWLGAGFVFTLTPQEGPPAEAGALTMSTDSDGWADFGEVQPGQYILTEIGVPGNHDWRATSEPINVDLVLGEDGSDVFGNQYDVVKRFELNFDNAPPNVRFFVYYSVNYDSGSTYLELQPEGGKYVAETPPIPSHSYISYRWMATTTGDGYEDWRLGPWVENERLDNGENVVLNTLDWQAAVRGYKYNDMYGNGQDDSYPLEGWRISLYRVPDVEYDVSAINAASDPYPFGELWGETYTDEEGYYQFEDLLPGQYYVVEEDRAGWEHTSASAVAFTIDEVEGAPTQNNWVDFYNHRDVTKTFELDFGKAPEGAEFWVEYEASCLGGCHYSDETSEPNWQQELDLTGSGPKYGASESFPYGTEVYGVQWWAEYEGVHYLLGEEELEEELLGNVTNRFVWDPSASGYKFGDEDGDGVWDEGEVGLEGWTIYLYRAPLPTAPDNVEAQAIAPQTPDGYELYATTVTDENGYYEFDGLFPGAYMVAEEVREEWKQTLAPDAGFSIIENGTHITDLNFGNQEPFAPFTPEEEAEAEEEEEEEFLPFTGADIAGLVLAVGVAVALGAGLRRTSRRLR